MDKIALFGAGQIGASLLGRLSAEKIDISYFIDNHKTGEYCGLPIIHLDQAVKEKVKVYIASVDYYDEIEQQLRSKNVTILGCKSSLMNFFTRNECAIKDVTIEFDVNFALAYMENFAIDLVDSCQLQCSYCARGLGVMPNTNKIMPLDKFERVCNNVKLHKFKTVALYNWTEPFLCRELEKYINMFRSIIGNDVYLSLSSNLSLPKIENLKEVLLAGPSELVVSVSGFHQRTHEIYHIGSKIDIVKKHLAYISTFTNDINVNVMVKFLDFGYNQPELPLFQDYALNLGLGFTTTMGYGSPLTPLDPPTLEYYEGKVKEHFYDKWDTVKYGKSVMKFCNASLCIDCNADVFLCCQYPNLRPFRIGNYLEDDIKQILTLRQLHPFCTGCIAKKN